LVGANQSVEDDEEFPHRNRECHLLEFPFRQQSLIEGFNGRIESRCNEWRHAFVHCFDL